MTTPRRGRAAALARRVGFLRGPLLCAAIVATMAAPPPLQAQVPDSTDADSTGARARALPPDIAWRQGMMPLASTGVDRFVQAHPTWDGRGVLIGILDSGVDPAIPGLLRTSTGERKVLDLRDFSGEGRVPLTRLNPAGDVVEVGGLRLRGFARVRALNATGPYWSGVLRERPLGAMPASDLDGNGSDLDVHPFVVTRASDGWVLLTDTDGDGSLADERPVHDYLVANETFGYGRQAPHPLTLAANLSDAGESPELDLFFDTSGHGSHVAGIAAGHDLYGVAGFNGVAPGAQLLGLKIANDAQGGITTSGSMRAAIAYAIRFARDRRLPLVLNMSFGVGNEVEGRARIDAVVDSILAANPDVTFAVSAGNDGPGLSTVGFPGSASRVLSVAASLPGAFLEPGPRGPVTEQLAYFSSRGGESGKPDLVAPGVAYSTVPPWDIGGEVESGTSMASPHAAGLAALLVGALVSEKRTVEARMIRHALMVTARPLPGEGFLDQGTGLADVDKAWSWLARTRTLPLLEARTAEGGPTAWRGRGLASAADTLQRFELSRPGRVLPETYTLKSDAPWLVAPATVTVGAGRAATVTLRYRAKLLAAPGIYTGVVTVWSRDPLLGPLARLVNTVVVPLPAGTARTTARVEPGVEARVAFPVDSGRPFDVRVATNEPGSAALARLYEQGGMPVPGSDEVPIGAGPQAKTLGIDGADSRGGIWELVLTSMPGRPATATVQVEPAPLRLGATREGDRVVAALTSLAAAALDAKAAALAIGAERQLDLGASGGATKRLKLVIPAWSQRLRLDLEMPRDQWHQFTDFGVSLFDAEGRQLAKEPMNYHRARLEAEIPGAGAERTIELALFPGLADNDAGQPWALSARARLYADSAVALKPVSGDRFAAISLNAGATAEAAFTAKVPWALPDGWRTLLVILAEVADHTWTREGGVGEVQGANR